MSSLLKHFHRKGIISNRVWQACKRYKLKSVEDLIKYRSSNGHFKNLYQIGEKENEVLLKLCDEGKKFSLGKNERETSKTDIQTIENLLYEKTISTRTYNVCIENSLTSIEKIIDYQIKNQDFFKLRKVGRVSNEELIQICEQHKDQFLNNDNALASLDLNNLNAKLTRFQREVINSFISVNTQDLTVRSKNAIKLYLEGNIKLTNFSNRILLKENFSLRNLKNVGTKSVGELKEYISKIKDFIIEVNQNQNEKYLTRLKNKYLLQNAFDTKSIPNDVLEADSIFKVTDYLLNQNLLFDRTKTIVFKTAFRIALNQKKLTIAEIANEVNAIKGKNITTERIRQLRNRCSETILTKLNICRNINDDIHQKYNIEVDSNQVKIDDTIVEKINRINKISFSREFITYILYSYLDEAYSLVGVFEDILQIRYSTSRNRHSWKNFYLVRSSMVSEFDFISLANDIDERLKDRIDESYSFNIKSYLSRFLINNNIATLESLLSICENIINEEFDIYLDLDENITFKRNTYKQIHEYIYEALEKIGKPSTVDEIFKKVNELYPGTVDSTLKVRVAMKRKNGFVPIGRKSVFGLKKWENEIDNFKGGTIREIVEEYLLQFSAPKHISDITEHVLIYRPKSNQNSITQNLKLDQSGIYTFYKGSNVGLSTKKYSKEYLKSTPIDNSDRKSWEERFNDLKNFTTKENRLPFSTHVSIEEIKLYRWLNVQKVNQKKGKLPKIKAIKLDSLLAKYATNNGRRRLNSSEKYQELLSFISNNHRLPSAIRNGEEKLYQFFYKQRKLFDKNELDSEEKNKFIEVAELLQNIKYENKRN